MSTLDRVLRSPLGAAIARPWLDRVALRFLIRRFFPVSRLWAAAEAAGEASGADVERFFAEVPLEPAAVRGLSRDRVAGALGEIAELRRTALRAEEAWTYGLFGPGAAEDRDGVARLEGARRDAAHAYMSGRWRLTFLLRRTVVPPVRWAISSPGMLESRYGHYLDSPDDFYATPEEVPIAVSPPMTAGGGGQLSWLRFPSPAGAMGDTVHARVFEPRDGPTGTTVIFCHGLGVEMEHWRGFVDCAAALRRAGIRVVEPEAPWHGRRRPHGRWGGERFVSRGPHGALATLGAATREVARLTAWARATGARRVGVAGISLGALTAQLVAAHARLWPAEMRPDAALLVTTSDSLAEIALRGSLAVSLGVPEALRRAGWSRREVERWAALGEPRHGPAIDPAAIVMLLGRVDDLTPYAGGLRLAERWEVPAENRFEPVRGHFSVAAGLLRDTAALDRFVAVLGRRGG